LQTQTYRPVVLTNLGNLHAQWAERYRYQATSAHLEGDSQEEARLIKLANQNLTSARDAYEQGWQQSQRADRVSQVTALLNLNRFLEHTSR